VKTANAGGLCPGSELGVLADYWQSYIAIDELREDFCSVAESGRLGSMTTELQGILTCVMRLASLPPEKLVFLEPGINQEPPSSPHHYALHGQSVGWESLTEPRQDLPERLHYLQLCTSKHRSRRLTCHVMLVALYEQDGSTVRMGSKAKPYHGIFFDGLQRRRFADVHDHKSYTHMKTFIISQRRDLTQTS
jgi:hypothetical protein